MTASTKRAVPPDISEAVRTRLRIDVAGIAHGLVGGRHTARLLGPSVEFSEHREYQPGDDLRYVDWRATARSDRTFIKAQERNIAATVLLALDDSASMDFPQGDLLSTKWYHAASLLASAGWLLLAQGDAVGAVSLCGRAPQVMPSAAPHHAARLVDWFGDALPRPGASADLGHIVHAVKAVHRPCVVFLASDLWRNENHVRAQLRALRAGGHHVVILRVISPQETTLPGGSEATFRDPETGAEITVRPVLLQEAYARRFAANCDAWRSFCAQHGIALIHAYTDAPIPAILTELRRRIAGRWRTP